MNIVQTFVEQQRVGGPQRQGRALQRQVRQRALEVTDRLAEAGVGLEEAAQRLGVTARTLRHWEQHLRQPGAAVALLGRPRADAGSDQQQAVLAHLQTVGAGVSVPALRGQFPDLARAELDELAKCYRALWQAQHARDLHVLHWLRPGASWAMDFAHAPVLSDGIYPYLLAVRDLASGQQLLWQPVRDTTSAVVRAALLPLFLAYGAPWVLKSDNGPAFRADATKRFLTRWEVFAVFSPPHMPSYNGSIEAAIGSLKTRTQRLAAQAGHPEVWTSAVVEAARREANQSHPRRLHGATPDEVWDARRRLTAEERTAFRARAQRYQAEGREQQGLLPEDELSHWTQAAVDRVALRRALLAHDLLLFTRRSIPAPIERPKAASKG